ncbi:MAG: PKD domain-containing protein [Bacteroidota bacterium]
MRFFLLVILIVLKIPINAQVSADFNLPAEVCVNQNIYPENTSINADSFEWDFCPIDLDTTNIQYQDLTPTGINKPFESKVVTLENTRYLFTPNRLGGNLLRTEINPDESLGLTETISLSGITNPSSLEIKKIQDVWYGFLTDFGSDKLFKLTFGTDLLSSPSIEEVTITNTLSNPARISAIQENDSLNLFIGNDGNNNLIQLQYDKTDLNNIVNETNIEIASVSNTTGLNIVKVNDIWSVFTVSRGSNKIVQLEFNNGLSDNPIVQEINTGSVSLNAPTGITFLKEIGGVFGYILSRFGDLYRFKFDLNLENPVFTSLGKAGGSASGWSLDYFRNYSNDRNIYICDFTSNQLKRIQFDDQCSASQLYSSEVNPIVSYNQSGIYKVSLKAIDELDNYDITTKEITIGSDSSPIGEVILDSTYCIADNITFSFNTTDDIASYNWDFGDGNTSTAISPTHQYTSDGEYFIALEVENSAGCPNIFYDTLSILPEPQPEFTTASTEYCTFENIDFTNTTPFDYGENVEWSWDFNGEESSTSENPSFTFETPGTKIISLEANVLGCVETYQDTLEIIEGPQVDFSFDSNCLGESIQFSNLSTGGNITDYQWDFGNGETSTAENPQMTYNNPGTYDVSLTVSNSSGCENTATQNIQIFETIVDSIMATEAIENLAFDLGIDWKNDFDSTQNLSYQWDIDGEIQTTDTATYSLPQGNYIVNLEITTKNNCLYNAQRSIEVKASEYPTPDFNLPSEACLDERFELVNSSINSESYIWDFCSNDFKNNLNVEAFYQNSNFSQVVNAKIIQEDIFDSLVYTFIGSSNGELYLSIDNPLHYNFNNIQGIINGSESISRPSDIDLIKIDDVWYGYLIDLNNDHLFEIEFGEEISFENNIIRDLGTFSSLNRPFAIKAITESDTTKLVISNFSSNNITYLKRHQNDENFIEEIILNGVGNVYGLDIKKFNGNWIGTFVYNNSGKIVYANFGSRFNGDIVESFEFTDTSINDPRDANLIIEHDSLYSFITSQADGFFKLEFGNEFSTTPNITSFGDLGVMDNDSRGFSMFKNSNSEWQGIIVQASNTVSKFSFENDCPTEIGMSNESQLINSYSQPGTYPITLTAYHPNGNSESISKEITVTENQAPEIAFTTGEDLCVSAPIQFSSESNAEISSYSWDFGDGNSSTEANPEHLFSSSGEYLVQLSVTDTAGCNNLFQDSITVYEEPVPDFQANAQGSICSQKPVNFENTTTLPTDATFQWDFGDGNTSTEENPEHIYAAEGEYIINFQIEMAGCLVEKSDTITVNPGPLVDFSYSDDCFGQVVNFENSSTGDFLQSFQWDFGDGTQSTQTSPNHSYDSAGTYRVQLTAFTSNGCDYTFEQEVIVHPVATVAFESEVGCADQPLQFNEQVTLQQSNVIDYLWDFGVSGTSSDLSTEANPEFTFPTAGTYEVSLQVTTADGCTSSGTQSVSVNALPQPAFTYDDNCLNNAILFSPENTDNIIAHFWELQNEAGDVVFTAQSENFSYAFENPGTYQLRYRQQNENLCSNSTTEAIEILPLPEPDFQVGNICAKEAIVFENLTDLKGNILKNYNWSIDGEVISTDFRPQYTFQDSGDYLLGLQVETQNGCIQSIEKSISVSPTPEAFFELEQTLAAYPYTLSLSAQSQGQTAVRPAKQNTETSSDDNQTGSIGQLPTSNTQHPSSIQLTIDNKQLTKGSSQLLSDTILSPFISIYFNNISNDSSNHPSSITQHPTPNTLLPTSNQLTIDNKQLTKGSSQLLSDTILSPFISIYFNNISNDSSNHPSSITQHPTPNTLLPTSNQLTIDNKQLTNRNSQLIADTNLSPFISTYFNNISNDSSTYQHTISSNHPSSITQHPTPNTQHPTPNIIWTLNNDTISTNTELNHTITEPGTYLLGLILTNEAGCTDSHYEQIRIREPNLDIALNNLRITEDQEFTSFVLNISNRGTLVPERIDLDIDLGSYSVTETIEESLLPEKNRNVALSIKLTEDQIRDLAKICIRAIPHNAAATESNLNNNRVCTNIESGLTIMEIYPNPVSTRFTLPMILPENATVNLSLEQSSGQTVKEYNYDMEAGYNEIQIDRKNIKPGIYFLRIRYQGKEKVKKIIFQ